MKIICIGRNYHDHVQEMKSDLPSKPVFFMKPDTALLRRNRPFYVPDWSKEIHYEAELVLKVCKLGKYIDERFAHTYYSHVGVGIDFTARDLQEECKKKGLPWEISKSFNDSAPVSGKFIAVDQLKNREAIAFKLLLNNELRQSGNSEHMIFSFEKIISYVSQFVTLQMGDLIFTGTPAGVGAVKPGDLLEVFLEEEKLLYCQVK
jgi:acylpyruvate hydrolase